MPFYLYRSNLNMKHELFTRIILPNLPNQEEKTNCVMLSLKTAEGEVTEAEIR